jgi:hypothetical protein
VLAGAAAVVAGALAYLHGPIIWKLAQQTLFYADFAGLRELLGSYAVPGGLLDWLARGVQVTGLGGVWWMFYALAAGVTVLLWRLVFRDQRESPLAVLSFPAALLCIYPALLAGTAVWMLDDPSSGFRNAFGLWTAMGVYVLGRSTRRWIAAVASILLFPWFGVYPFLGAVAASVWCLPLLLLPACATPFYNDIAVAEMYLRCGAVVDRLRFCSLNVWTVGAFACFFLAAAADRFRWAERVKRVRLFEKSRMTEAFFAVALLVVVAGVLDSRPRPDLRGQFVRERAVVEGRWRDVLSVAPSNGNALRMESAYRILALQRLDMLPQHLFDEPLWSTHDSTDAQEDLMDGHELLFAYGLFLPARRYLFETMSTKRWVPRHFQVLGDIALLFGENALAERNYRLMLRCPYYRDAAKSRLAVLAAEKPSLPKDLESAANCARTLMQMLKDEKVEFFDVRQNAEQLVYSHFVSVKKCDTSIARFCFSCMLLEKKHSMVAMNDRMLGEMFGSPADVPACVQQALLVAGGKSSLVSPVVMQQAMMYQADAKRAMAGALAQDVFLSRWAASYFFYNEFVK